MMAARAPAPRVEVDAERAVIGACVRRPEALARAPLQPEDFGDPKNRELWRAMLDMDRQRKTWDPILLESEMGERWAAVGGYAYVSDCVNSIGTADNVEFYAELIAEAAITRRVRLVLSDVLNSQLEGEELRQKAEKALVGLVRAEVSAPAVAPPHAVDTVALLWGRPLPSKLSTGLGMLDAALGGGMRAESVYVVAGATGRGKSGLAVQIGMCAARARPTVYLTTELSERQVIARVVAQRLCIPWREVYEWGPSEVPVVQEALSDMNLRVVECGPTTVIRDVLDLVADDEGVAPFAVLDYLQHLGRRAPGDDHRVGTAAASDDLTSWARDARSTALVLSSASRGFYAGNAERGSLDFLGAAKHSGDVEFDAAAVMFLDLEPDPGRSSWPCKLHVPKSRFGPSGTTVGLLFDARVGTFVEDPASALSEMQREVLEAIRDGAQTANAVQDATKRQRKAVQGAVKALAGLGLITTCPLQVTP